MPGKPQIIYVADPMCSWCWAFSPQLEKLRTHYADAVQFRLIAGGLRQASTPLSREQAQGLGAYWQTVMDSSGQQFNTHFQAPAGFAYNTEPACRALVGYRQQRPARVFEFLAALHAAFYLHHEDITQPRVLAAIAQSHGLDEQDFIQRLQSPELRLATQADFDERMQWGIDGFPTLLFNYADTRKLLAQGYQRAEQIIPVIDSLLV